MLSENKIAARAAREIKEGQVVNCGIGIPSLIPKFTLMNKPFLIHSENGILGMGHPSGIKSADRNLIDAGATYVCVNPGASFFDISLSFTIIRGGHLDIAFLGALEVDESGDLANWIIPGKYSPGIGGGMELAQKAKRVIVTITHTTKDGRPKILRKCKLPLTAKSCVNTIITELAVIDVTSDGLLLRELAEDTDVNTLFQRTEASVKVPDGEITRF
jgi:3-oxoacid CoA-transferase B subunit